MKKAPSYIYSIIGISLVLFPVGHHWLAGHQWSLLSRFFKEQIEVQVILHDNTQDDKSRQLEEILKKQSFVSGAKNYYEGRSRQAICEREGGRLPRAAGL